MSSEARPVAQAHSVCSTVEVAMMVFVSGLWVFGWLLRSPSMLEGIDFVRYYFFQAEWLGRHLRAGELPFWNPHIGLGRPFWADLQVGVLYPPNWLHALMDVRVASVLIVWGHLAWALMGVRLWARSLGIGRTAGWTAALLFMLLPAVTARLASGQIHYVAGLCHVPMLFWLTTRLIDSGAGKWGAGVATVGALQILCGHPQVYWFTQVGLGVYAGAWLSSAGWRATAAGLARLVGFAVLGLGLTAPVLIPFLQLVSESNRAAEGGTMSGYGAMIWRDWLGLVWAPNDHRIPDVEAHVWMGFPLALLAAWALWRGWRERSVRGLAALALVALVLASELPEGVRGLLEAGMPGFAAFRLHARTAFLTVVALLMLAAWGCRWVRWPRWAWALVCAGVLLPLLSISPGLKRWHALPQGFPMESSVAGLVRELRADASDAMPPRLNITPRLVRENFGMVSGYSGFAAYVSLYLARPWVYVHAVAGLPEKTVINTFPDVRIYERTPFLYNSMNVVAGSEPPSGRIRLAENPDPRAYLCTATRKVTGWREAIQLMAAGFDFHGTALIESTSGARELTRAAEVFPGQKPVQVTTFHNERVGLKGASSSAAILVLAEAWYPGWTAKVNGVKAEAFPVNGWMRGVVVPPGDFEVEWTYHEPRLGLGCLVALVAGALLLTVSSRKNPFSRR